MRTGVTSIETVERAGELLRRQGRISLRALKLEFDLDDEQLEALVEKLVIIERVAAREGKTLVWKGGTAQADEAEALAEPASTLEIPSEAERRQLTILFCDLVGSTELASHLDPEEWRDVVSQFQQACAEITARFEGYVAQYLGDGVLVYFGYPRAHEDDAERAVRAALDMLEATRGANPARRQHHGLELAVRIGIHTGLVVVGEMRDGGRHETLAFGDTMNVAARLQELAPPNTVLFSSATLRLVSGIFVTHDRGMHALKGRPGPVRVHQAIQPSGVRSRLDLMSTADLTPFVGRSQDLMLLEDSYTRAAEGRGQAMLICGEPGIGKSRVLQVFRKRIGERAHTWLECRGSPYKQDTAFHPVLELHRQGLAFRPEDAPETKLERIEAGLAAVGFDPGEAVPLVAALNGVPLGARFGTPVDSPEAMRRKTLVLLADWLLRLAQRQPLVLLLEDLQWMDPSTLELVGGVLERIPTAPLLLVCTHRPDFRPPWPARPHVARTTLGPLTQDDAALMVKRITGTEALPPALREEVVARSDGVPLFVEELTLALLESDLLERGGVGRGAEPKIPETLQDSLAARLDRLGPVRDVAQSAAVIGREFSYELLASVCDPDTRSLPADLEQLERAGLVYRRGTPPRADYTFKHALVHESAYQSLLRGARRRRHAQLARLLQQRFPERVLEEPEVVARHCQEGGLTEEAIAHYRRAFVGAARRAANAEAVSHLTKALELLRTLPESPERDRRELALQVSLAAPLVAARGWGNPEVKHTYGRARELCDRVGETPELFRVVRGLLVFYVSRADLATADELCTRLLRLAEAHPEGSARAVAHQQMAIIRYYRGEPRSALEHYEQALVLYDPADRDWLTVHYGQDLGVFIRVWMAWCQWILGEPERALTTALEAIDLAREAAHPFSLAYALLWCAVVRVFRRERAATRDLATQALDVGRQEDFDFIVEGARVVHAWSRLDPEMTPEEHEAAIEEMREAGSRMATASVVSLPMNLAVTADVLRAIGRRREAAAGIQRALAFSKQTGDAYWDADLFRIRADLLAEEGGVAEAEQILQRALQISRNQHAKSLELRAATSLARVWRSQGKAAEAAELLEPVYSSFTEGFETQDLKDAKALLEELSAGSPIHNA